MSDIPYKLLNHTFVSFIQIWSVLLMLVLCWDLIIFKWIYACTYLVFLSVIWTYSLLCHLYYFMYGVILYYFTFTCDEVSFRTCYHCCGFWISSFHPWVHFLTSHYSILLDVPIFLNLSYLFCIAIIATPHSFV